MHPRLTYDALFSARFNTVFAPILELPPMITSAPDVKISGTTATVSWEFPGGSVSDYIVEYVLSSEGFTSPSVINTSTDGTQPSVCIDNLQPHSSYLLRVAVQNSSGRSEFSPEAQFSTQEGECEIILVNHSIPEIACIQKGLTYDVLNLMLSLLPFLGLPQMITSAPDVKISGTTATVSWEFPGGSVSDYVVEYTREGSTSPSVLNTDETQTSVRVDKLQPLSKYSLRVAVQNSSGRSEFSLEAQFSTQEGECEII